MQSHVCRRPVSTWIGLLVTLIATSFVLFLLVKREGKYRENYVWSLITALLFSTGQYAEYWPVKIRVKLFMATFFFYGLHINTAYHSSLINVLTNPRYESQIDSVEVAIQEKLTFHLAENALAFLEKDDQVGRIL